MSQLREYAGKGWHEWPSLALADSEEVSLASSPSHSDLASGDITPSSSRASSPHPLPKDDVTKLPRQDMHMFGQCPVQDDFTMAVCDSCGLIVKLEAFASHIKLRHGLPLKFATTASASAKMAGSSGSSGSSTSSRHSTRNLKPCSVDLLKLSAQLKTKQSVSSGLALSCGSLSLSSGSSGGVCSSSSSSSCPPPSRSKTPTPDKEFVTVHAMADEDESMEVDGLLMSTSEIKVEQTYISGKFGAEDDDVEMDSASNGIDVASNVISIPDTDPLPHNMSGDLMAMVTEVTRPLDGLDHHSPSYIQLQVHQDDNALAAASTTTLLLAPSSTPMVTSTSGTPISVCSPFSNMGGRVGMQPQQATAILVQPASGGIKTLLPNQPDGMKLPLKPSPNKKGVNVIIGGGPSPLTGRNDRKPTREYHPDRHCGVWDPEAARHCTRALTCKSHSVLLKRKVDGRSKPFDELLAAHKKAQAALASAAANTANAVGMGAVSTSMLSPTMVALPTTPVAQPVIQAVQLNTSRAPPGAISLTATNKPPAHIMFPLQPVQPQQLFTSSGVQMTTSTPAATNLTANREFEDWLHYTNDHPKPLAVCSFGGRRIGGLLFTDRSRILTRKLARVAITSAAPGMRGTRTAGVSGFHRIGPKLTLLQGCENTNSAPITVVNALKDQFQRGRDIKEPPTFLLNYSLGGVGGKRTIIGANITASPLVGVQSVNVSSLQPLPPTAASNVAGISGVLMPESFKTDIQDFKGGIKFELGSKIKQIHSRSDHLL